MGVGRHDGAVHVQIAAGQDVQGIPLFFHVQQDFLVTGAVVDTDHAGTAFFQQLHDFVRPHTRGDACQQDTGSIWSHSRRGVLQFRVDGLQQADGLLIVRHERGPKTDVQQIETPQGRRTPAGQIQHLFQGLTQAGRQIHGSPQLLFRYLDAKVLFQTGHQQGVLLPPVGMGAFILDLRKLQDHHGLVGSQEFIHFFLAVTGGIRHHDVGSRQIGAAILQGKAEAALDQGTQTARQHLFRHRDGVLLRTAQRDRYGTRRKGDLQRGIDAELPHHLATFFPGFLQGQHVTAGHIPKMFKTCVCHLYSPMRSGACRWRRCVISGPPRGPHPKLPRSGDRQGH